MTKLLKVGKLSSIFGEKKKKKGKLIFPFWSSLIKTQIWEAG